MEYLNYIFDPNSKLTVIFICLTCYMLPAFHGRAFKVCCFSLYLPLFYFLNLILFRVNSLYHLVHMSTTQSRRYLGRYLDVWKIIFRVIFQFCNDTQHDLEMGLVEYYIIPDWELWMGVTEMLVRRIFIR